MPAGRGLDMCLSKSSLFSSSCMMSRSLCLVFSDFSGLAQANCNLEASINLSYKIDNYSIYDLNNQQTKMEFKQPHVPVFLA